MNKNHFFYTYNRQKLIFFLSFVAFFSSAELNAQTLVWQEEFNSNSLDGNLWTYDFSDGCERNLCGWGNAELQYYTSRPENVRVENGNLIIEARNENFGNRAFTSGRVKSEGRFHFKYGTLEARIKIPNLANGIWPAFWTLGTIGGTWPSIGEIDVMEMGNQSARLAGVINKQVTSAVHYSNNGSYSSTGSSINSTVNLNNDYHLYKLVWNAQTVNMYLDNVLFNTFDISNPSNTSKEEFHQPHFILLNMSIGGAYTGLLNNSDITAPMPAQMLVDYIRLYQHPGDVINYGAQNITSGNWGVFTETTSVTSNLTIGQNATFYTWNNLSSINSATPFEGSNVLAYRANAGNWFGMGLENNYINLSGHMSGSLKFHFKTSYSGQFKFGIKTGHGESWINIPAGATTYGIIRDGNWHEVSIPLTEFDNPSLGRNFDKMSVKSAFMFAGDAPAANADFYFDNIYFSKNTNAPTLSAFSVPTKSLGQAPFTLTPPTSNSSGSFSYTSSNTAVATISGNMVTIVGVGNSTITATQAPAGSYSTGSITATFAVNYGGPATAAPVPPSRGNSDYKSIYVDSYSNMAGTDFNPFWGQSTLVSDFPIAGNNHKKYDLFNYQGIQLAAVADVSGMQYVHFDLWTPNCSSFDLYLINTTPSLLERKVTVTPVLNGWNSYDFPLSQFSPVAMNNISQFKLMGTPAGTSIVYWDNLYFWKAAAITTPVVSVVQPNCSTATGAITVTSSTVGLSFSIDGVNYNNTTGIFTGLIPGIYSLTAMNASGSISSAVSVTILAATILPVAPVIISGVRNINKCDTLQNYIVSSLVGNNYTWSVSGTGNYIKNGQGSSTASIVMKVAGTITVKAVNSCGTSPATSYAVTKAAPSSPSGIYQRFVGSTTVAADVNVCKFTQIAYASTGVKDTFRIRTTAFATGYYFQVPAGASMTRVNDTTIAVVFADTTTTGATIKAYSLSACDTSLAKVLTLTRTLAATPSGIFTSFNANSTSGPAALTSVCSLVGNGSSTYMIRKMTTAQSYIWSLRRGTHASLSRLATAGMNDTSYRVTFSVGFTKDTLEVKSVNGCGVSVAKTVIMNATLAPPAVSAITANTGNLTPCIGNMVQYTATATPPTTSQSAIVVYRWTKPNFTTITSAAPDSSSITIRYDAGFTGGAITAKGQSNCGIAGSVKSVTLLYLPPTPTAITSSTGVYNFCIGSTSTFTATVAAPSTSQRAAVVYRWTKPNNTVIVSAASDSSSITLQFNTGFTGGVLTVKGQTACGAQGSAKSQSITHTGCPVGTKLIAGNETVLKDFQLNVYPSPSNGNFTVNIATGIEQSGTAQIQLIDMYGKVVAQYNATNNAGRIVRAISNNKLADGMYLLKITCGSWNKTERVVVNKK